MYLLPTWSESDHRQGHEGGEDSWPAVDVIPIASGGTPKTSQNSRGELQGKHNGGSAPGRRGREIAPPPRRTPLDNQSTSRADGSAKWQAVAWCLEPWCTHRNAGWERDRACSRRPDSLWEIHRPTIGLSGTIGRHLSDLSCFLQRQTEAATFALPGQSSDTTRVISAWWQQHLPSLPPTTYICHFCAFGMQATAVVKKTRSTDSKRDRWQLSHSV